MKLYINILKRENLCQLYTHKLYQYDVLQLLTTHNGFSRYISTKSKCAAQGCYCLYQLKPEGMVNNQLPPHLHIHYDVAVCLGLSTLLFFFFCYSCTGSFVVSHPNLCQSCEWKALPNYGMITASLSHVHVCQQCIVKGWG